MSPTIHRIPIAVPTGDGFLSGCLFRAVDDLVEPQPGVVVSGSWLTVKEQMATRYALELAARGFTVLTFDFTGWGDSPGAFPNTEIPLRKVADIVAATTFLRSLSCVRGDEVGYVAVCASAMYAAAAVEAGAPIAALASIAGWLHDTGTVASFYGGRSGIATRLSAAARALESYRDSRVLVNVPAFEVGNERAGMFIPMDYYANPARGRVPEWPNLMSEISWTYWLTFDGLRAARKLRVPTLFVHGDECALPDNVRSLYARIQAPKHLVWHPGFQADYYDREDLVTLSADAARDWLGTHL